ncbi:MAG: NTP transferase domain-containing protein [Candidatus Heimdallarchaeum endolithica]|uniref:NTP transferase domain-containing protein n=1 Tax=Candidatus Heimdallarchaeum endolithica TaxID=2876572 RepID=A0A9Y1FPB8_9ARCH|nr:MAG: NTP transferase domain-containing protein [Candidatus Heimdallarchaeum endolithica]
MKGVVLAAGHGSRLLPFTSFRPKHLLPVAGKPILHRSIEYMRDMLDIDDIIIVVGYQRNAIIDYFKNGEDLGINISYVIQHTNQAHGLAAAVNLIEDKISNDFVVLLGDNLFSANLKKVIDLHTSSNAAATLHIEEHENPQRFGVVEIDENDNVISLEEKPKNPKSNYVISGFYVFSPIIFQMISGLQPSARGEYELTDAIQRLVDNNYKVKVSKINGWRLDIGYPEDLLAVNKHYLNEKTHKILGNIKNSNIVPPVYIAEDCEINSSTIGPYVMIEKGVKVENSEIKNSVILENSKLERVFISDSVVGTNSEVIGLKAHSLKVGDYSFIRNGVI